MILTYSRVLSIIKKALWELMEEYQGVGKFLQDLEEEHGPVGEDWGHNRVERSSKDGLGESQEEGTP